MESKVAYSDEQDGVEITQDDIEFRESPSVG